MRPVRHAVELAPAAQDESGCWGRIGVRGDRSCPELRVHAHCRNCPAHSAAAARLLDREAPDVAIRPAASFADPINALDAAHGATESAVIFRLASEWFALPTLLLDEIVGPRPIHRLPHRRNTHLLGIANIRGDLVICGSLAEMLTGGRTDPSKARLIVLHDGDVRIALPVDEVQQACRYRPSEMLPPPATIARAQAAFTRGLLPWRERLVACLDGGRVIAELKRKLA